MEEPKVFYTNPINIKIKDELPRYRKDLTNLTELVNSIKEFGQLQPAVITRDMELIAGGRRLAACLLGEIDILCIFKEDTDDITMREIELEENLQREDLTAAEHVRAVADLHKLKQLKYGTAVSGKEGSGWRLEDSAKVIGKTAGSVIADLALAAALEEFPSLSTCKTKSDMKKAAKSNYAAIERIVRLKDFEETIKGSGIPVTIVNEDAVGFIKSIPDGTVKILLTDPPYGINIDKIAIQMGGVTGGDHTTSGYKFDDSRDNALELLASLAVESYRFCSHDAHAFIFVAPEMFGIVREMFLAVGWLVHIRPMVWIKMESGQNNAPHAWPSAAYEFILYARKAESVLALQGKPDWIQCDPVLPSVKIHPTEKPVKLLEELIARTTQAGDILLDPFMGSGSAIEAGIGMNLVTYGCEILEEAYAAACSRIDAVIRKKEEIKKRAMAFDGAGAGILHEPFMEDLND